MKLPNMYTLTNPIKTRLGRLAALSAVVWIFAASAPAETTTNLPCPVSIGLGDAQFVPGDSITIEKVTGTGTLITNGGVYCVEGSYTLSSHDQADLGFFTTVNTSAGASFDQREIVHLNKGSGTFRLTKRMSSEGYLHVSFYAGNSFGRVYFGQGKWVLHNGNYSAFASTSFHHSSGSQANGASTPALSIPNPIPNLAMLKYLGNPVETPAHLASSYTPEGLTQAIRTAARQAGVTVGEIEIEGLEFPPLIGMICDNEPFEKLVAQLKTMKDYTYQGSVGSYNCHVMSIIPYQAFPEGSGEQIERRLMLREQMLYNHLNTGE